MLEKWLLIASILMPLKAMNSKNISVKARHVGGEPPGGSGNANACLQRYEMLTTLMLERLIVASEVSYCL